MKQIFFISVLVLSYLFIGIASCGKEESMEKNIQDQSPEVISNVEKTIINDTDYVPPIKGKENKKWYGNRNRKLTADSSYCNGKGNRHRHRYGWRWQN